MSKRFPLRKKQAENNLFRPWLIFGLTCAVLRVRLKDLFGGEFNAKASCTVLGLADNGGSGAGGAAMGDRNRRSSAAGRDGGRTERATICGVEYYYKAKWGHAEEFLALFKKNHYPVLKKEIELGRMLKVSMTAPRYHATEDGRWDYRVTIVFKSAAIANDNFDSAPLIKQLYPDQETYKKEEQRRFEILDAHWDLPLKDIDLEAR